MSTLNDLVKFIICEPGARSCWTYAKDKETADAIAVDIAAKHGKPYVVETWDEFDARTNAAWLSDFPLCEITQDFYDQMLNVLPPMYRDAAIGFFMVERTSGSITNQFVRRVTSDFAPARCYAAAVDLADRSTWITPEKLDALPDAPLLDWFGRVEGSS